MIEDLGILLDEEEKSRHRHQSDEDFDYGTYHTLSEVSKVQSVSLYSPAFLTSNNVIVLFLQLLAPILQIEEWMVDIENQYPDLITSFQIATSYEGREIRAFKAWLSHSKLCQTSLCFCDIWWLNGDSLVTHMNLYRYQVVARISLQYGLMVLSMLVNGSPLQWFSTLFMRYDSIGCESDILIAYHYWSAWLFHWHDDHFLCM